MLLGIQFRWLLTRGTLARALVTSAELAIDNAKEAAWMAMYEQRWQPLEDGRWGRVVGREGAGRYGEAMFWL